MQIFFRFKLLHEESIEYSKLGLRDNVAQICVFEVRQFSYVLLSKYQLRQ